LNDLEAVEGNVSNSVSEGLAGTGLLQSQEEWGARNEALAKSMSDLVGAYAVSRTGSALDVGCQAGALTDALSQTSSFQWSGIDPTIREATVSPRGNSLLPATAAKIPFDDGHFDVALFANVFEHVVPEERQQSLNEIFRVLRPGGVVVGQLPNPYFPIESHSRLPFMGWLPVSWQKVYWRLAPVPWEHDFYVVTMRHLRRTAEAAGFVTRYVRNFNYPPEVIPRSVRPFAVMLERPMRRFPWAWQFVLERPVGT
jgi:SAM-dependent methyltransferase